MSAATKSDPLPALLILDDEQITSESCGEIGEALGYQVFLAHNAETAYKLLESDSIDVVMLDFKVAGNDGLELLQELKRRWPQVEVIVTSSNATVESAIEAMKHGAFDYVTKPFDLDELKLLLERVAGHVKLSVEYDLLRQKVRSEGGLGSIIGLAPEMQKLCCFICKAAKNAYPVLIHGERGTGRTLVARTIHDLSPNHDKPFIPVDCGSLAPESMETELFGCVKGAVSGAIQSKTGLLQLADGGTVFLKQIDKLETDLQVRLLRAVHEKEIHPTGAKRPVPINLRLLAAGSRDLEAAVEQGEFRKDLYFRLSLLSLRIPPLRKRKQDIPLLVERFLDRLSHGSGSKRVISDEALKAMLAYDWPGNVRELENCLEWASAMSPGPLIGRDDLLAVLKYPKLM